LNGADQEGQKLVKTRHIKRKRMTIKWEIKFHRKQLSRTARNIKFEQLCKNKAHDPRAQ